MRQIETAHGAARHSSTQSLRGSRPPSRGAPNTSTQLKQQQQQVWGSANAKVCDRNVRDFGWEIAHGAVSRRPPISLNTMVHHTGGYTYDVGVWDLSIIQGTIHHSLSRRAKP
jgi:hypothetical protein